MSKIAFIAAFPPPITGQSLAADLLRKGLQEAGIEYYELDLAEPIGGENLLKRIMHLAKAEGRLAVLCIRHRDLIVYFQLGHGRLALVRDMFFMATAEAFGRPCIGHVHGSGFRKALDGLPRPIRWFEKQLIRRLKAAVVLSDSLRTMFDDVLCKERVHAVDNGIDPEFVGMTLGAEDRAQRDEFRILFLSNFLTAKGFSTVLRTAVQAQKTGKSWRFVFIGEKIAKQDVDIDAYIADYGLTNVEVSDVVVGLQKHAAYREADVFVLPSSYEGQPLCILEAMFEALPVITTKVGGIPEIFSDETGVRYVSPGAPEQIYDVLCEFEHEPEMLKRMGHANRELAMSRFTAGEHVRRMIEIIMG